MRSLTKTAAALFATALLACCAWAQEPAMQSPPPLPKGHQGIAARHPGDAGIASDPAVLLHDDFERQQIVGPWDMVFHEENITLTTDPAHVLRGERSAQITIAAKSQEDSNAFIKRLGAGHDVIFIRYYSRFDPNFDQIGSSHNGCYIGAISPGLPMATPGVRADGRNKFEVAFENWRGEAATPSPGHLNVYCYHPAQRSEYGDHFFPTGLVMPNTSLPFDFGPGFVARADMIPQLGRWYCYEFMVRANTPGQRDGRIACWVDGELIADFPNLRLRDDAALKINHASVGLHIKNNTIRANSKWYDDVVIATSYIGPVRESGPAGSATRP